MRVGVPLRSHSHDLSFYVVPATGVDFLLQFSHQIPIMWNRVVYTDCSLVRDDPWRFNRVTFSYRTLCIL